MHPVARSLLIGVVVLFVAMAGTGRETGAASAGSIIPAAHVLLEEAIDRVPQSALCGEPNQQKHRCHRVARNVTVTSDIRPHRRLLTPILATLGRSRIATESAREVRLGPADGRGRHLRLGFREIYAATRRMHS